MLRRSVLRLIKDKPPNMNRVDALVENVHFFVDSNVVIRWKMDSLKMLNRDEHPDYLKFMDINHNYCIIT